MAADEASTGRRAGALDARVLFPRVADAIDALPDGEREALLLFAWEDLSYQSVADALELPIGTVRSRLNRARTQLRELLDFERACIRDFQQRLARLHHAFAFTNYFQHAAAHRRAHRRRRRSAPRSRSRKASCRASVLRSATS